MLSGNVYSNIVGPTGLSHEDAWKAARRAALAEDVVVLEKGQVVQVGKYEELATVEGPFKRLAEQQVA